MDPAREVEVGRCANNSVVLSPGIQSPLLRPRESAPEDKMDLFDRLLMRETHEQAEHKVFPRPSEYAKLGIWILLLLTGWLLTRAVCSAGLPSDCQGKGGWDSVEVFHDVESMFLYGFVLAWFIGLHEPERFWFIFSWEKGHPLLFLVPFFLSGIIFAGLGEIPGMNDSFSSGSNIGAIGTAVYTIGGLVVFLVLLWHVRFAYNNYSGREFLSYVLGRTSVLSFYGIYSAILLTGDNEFHFHHYWIAWALALWAQHNHPLSVLFLGVSTGIFVQGIGAYSFADIFMQPNECRGWLSPVNSLTCEAEWPNAHDVRVCTTAWNVDPSFTCRGRG